MSIHDFAEEKPVKDPQNILSVCVLVWTCMFVCKHAYKLVLLVYTSTHVKQSVPVSVSRPNKPNRAQRASFSIHVASESLQPLHSYRICKTTPANASLSTFDNCKVNVVCSPMFVS